MPKWSQISLAWAYHKTIHFMLANFWCLKYFFSKLGSRGLLGFFQEKMYIFKYLSIVGVLCTNELVTDYYFCLNKQNVNFWYWIFDWFHSKSWCFNFWHYLSSSVCLSPCFCFILHVSLSQSVYFNSLCLCAHVRLYFYLSMFLSFFHKGIWWIQ